MVRQVLLVWIAPWQDRLVPQARQVLQAQQARLVQTAPWLDPRPDRPDWPTGDGFTGGSYAPSTGIVTFTSNDGLGFATADLRGATGPTGDGLQVQLALTGAHSHRMTLVPQAQRGPTGPTGPTDLLVQITVLAQPEPIAPDRLGLQVPQVRQATERPARLVTGGSYAPSTGVVKQRLHIERWPRFHNSRPSRSYRSDWTDRTDGSNRGYRSHRSRQHCSKTVLDRLVLHRSSWPDRSYRTRWRR